MTRLTELPPRLPSRRRFIAIGAAAAGVSALPASLRAAVPSATWRGIALGAEASATLAGVTQAEARPLFRRMESELSRLEDIFSLYRPHSALSLLNEQGILRRPPPELLEVLSLADAIHAETNGAFDPTVQPLWKLYAAAVRQNRLPDSSELSAARKLVGWGSVRFDADRVDFLHPGMGITLNGIAQGYISDRIAELLRAEGLRNVLVDMGEIHAVGQRPGGGPWRVGIRNPEGGILSHQVPLSNRALATSAPMGTVLDSSGRIGHIFSPTTGLPAASWKQVSVSASAAAMADGLATAFCLMERTDIMRAASKFQSVKVEKLIA